MAKFEYNPSENAKPEKRQQLGLGKCEVYGCPRDGHIKAESWNCRYHHNRAGKNLAGITSKLIHHESDVNWYEKVLQATIVDYNEGSLVARAPINMRPEEGEIFVDYRERMKLHINNLLYS